jgi:glyoxylase-like metal-dependent hydrolase (beta-lactamase superfamily II)
MVEQVFPDIFRLELPLPDNPLRSINSYVVKSPDRNLIIDTGMNLPECRENLDRGLKALNIDLQQTDILITHLHADHCGLVGHLLSPGAKVYGSRADADLINQFLADEKGRFWEQAAEQAYENGFANARTVLLQHPGNRSYIGNMAHIDFTVVEHGDIIQVGNYCFRGFVTPGHTPGHLCLYEADKKILFSGDHILDTITPNIALFSDDYNPLQEYIDSLHKVYDLDVNLTLPAHRNLIHNHRNRIEELLAHHNRRCQEIIDILSRYPGQPLTPYEIASMMNWDLKYDVWDDFPPMQLWFATGEAISHLQYLYEEGKVARSRINGMNVYTVSSHG